jgi:hypothetical protein
MAGRRKKRKQSTRTCLRCDREFMSDGIYNRICSNCRESNANIAVPYAESLEVRIGGISNRTRGGNYQEN